jgi:hypothetical protein
LFTSFLRALKQERSNALSNAEVFSNQKKNGHLCSFHVITVLSAEKKHVLLLLYIDAMSRLTVVTAASTAPDQEGKFNNTPHV